MSESLARVPGPESLAPVVDLTRSRLNEKEDSKAKSGDSIELWPRGLDL